MNITISIAEQTDAGRVTAARLRVHLDFMSDFSECAQAQRVAIEKRAITALETWIIQLKEAHAQLDRNHKTLRLDSRFTPHRFKARSLGASSSTANDKLGVS